VKDIIKILLKLIVSKNAYINSSSLHTSKKKIPVKIP